MGKMYMVTFITVFTVVSAVKNNTEVCIAPLLENGFSLCSQVDEFTQCYLDTSVSKTDLQSVQATLQAMSEIMTRFRQEKCDLNRQFNNECHAGFVNCLDMVTIMERGSVVLNCSESAMTSFLECTRIELPNAWGECYFSNWLQTIVNTTKDMSCNQTVPTPEEPGKANESFPTTTAGGLGPSDGFCIVGDTKYTAYRGCTVFVMEWVSLGIAYEPLNVAPGTLFDVTTCQQRHGVNVKCGQPQNNSHNSRP